MSRATVLARGRIAAERGMVDTCAIRRRSGKTTGAGGVISATWTTVYTGKCRVQITGGEAGQGTDVGESYLIVEQRQIQLPITATGILEGDQVTITAAAHDAELVDKVYTVRDVSAKSDATARRLVVTEATS